MSLINNFQAKFFYVYKKWIRQTSDSATVHRTLDQFHVTGNCDFAMVLTLDSNPRKVRT